MLFDDNFDPKNEDDIERLFSYLEKDKFNSLSLCEQNEVLDILLKISSKEHNQTSNVKTIGLVKGKDGFSDLSIQKIIDDIGYEPFREIMRDTISKGGLQFTALNRDDLRNLHDKAKNGNLSEDEIRKLRELLNVHHNSHEDVHFSSYTVLHLYSNLLARAKDNDEIQLLSDAEPFINAAYVALLSAFLSRNDNPIGKMFTTHGFEKTKLAIDDLTLKLSDLIIEYSKEHDLAPERTMIALLNVVRTIAEPLETSMDYPKNKVGEVLEHVLIGLSGLDDPSSIDKLGNKLEKDVQEDSSNNSANADIKESKNDVDIRKLLLDD
jgi:hypothetical protein